MLLAKDESVKTTSLRGSLSGTKSKPRDELLPCHTSLLFSFLTSSSVGSVTWAAEERS